MYSLQRKGQKLKIMEYENIEETEENMSHKNKTEEEQDAQSLNSDDERQQEEEKDKENIKEVNFLEVSSERPKRYDDHIVYMNYCSAIVPENYEEAIT